MDPKITIGKVRSFDADRPAQLDSVDVPNITK
jgi:hypothetical protein